jgi:hypothetical protein
MVERNFEKGGCFCWDIDSDEHQQFLTLCEVLEEENLTDLEMSRAINLWLAQRYRRQLN